MQRSAGSARFVERHQDALAGVFGSVVGLCAKAGLVGVNVVAVDGSKVSANASHEANVDYARLAREVLEDARAVDAEEDERFGDRRGGELPPELAASPCELSRCRSRAGLGVEQVRHGDEDRLVHALRALTDDGPLAILTLDYGDLNLFDHTVFNARRHGR